MLGLPGTWQTGRSGFHLNHLRSSWHNVDHPGAESPAGGQGFTRFFQALRWLIRRVVTYGDRRGRV